MPETSRPQPTRPADTRPPTRPGGSPPPSGPSSPTVPRPGRRILAILGLVVALAAIAILAVVCVMAAAWATTRSVYYIPDSSDWVWALVLVGFALSTGVSLILPPPRRPSRHLFVRSVRALVRGGGSRSTSGPATTPGPLRTGVVAPTPGTSARTSPAGGRAGLSSLDGRNPVASTGRVLPAPVVQG